MPESQSKGPRGFWTLATLALALLAGAYFSLSFRDAWIERAELRDKADSLERVAADIASDNAYKKEYHTRLATDQEFAERVIRETLGYAAKNEIVFKFDDKTFSPESGAGVSVERVRGGGS